MVHKSVLASFAAASVALVVFFVLTFPGVGGNVPAGVFAFVGLFAVIVASVFEDLTLGKKDVSLSTWFRALWILTLVILTWYCTRLGTVWGWW